MVSRARNSRTSNGHVVPVICTAYDLLTIDGVLQVLQERLEPVSDVCHHTTSFV